MFFDNKSSMYRITESVSLPVLNPVIQDFDRPFEEAALADINMKNVKAIYPMITAINSGRLTKNFTFYPTESLLGKKGVDPTGFNSFVKPYGKPIITEHNLQGTPYRDAAVPLGRVVAATYSRRSATEKTHSPLKKNHPGSLEGDGRLIVVAAVTDEDAMKKVLGGAFHTVSIGSNVENVWESISGKNIAELMRNGEELPPYQRGQEYNGQLSYWRMGEIRAKELSYVNNPSDSYAMTINSDVGEDGIRLLVGQKSKAKNESFKFYDAKTKEHVECNLDEFAYDETFFVDSIKLEDNIWFINKTEEELLEMQESVNLEDAKDNGGHTPDDDSVWLGKMVAWGGAKVTKGLGKIVSIHRDGPVPNIKATIIGSGTDPAALVKVYKDGKATDVHVGHKLKSLRLVKAQGDK